MKTNQDISVEDKDGKRVRKQIVLREYKHGSFCDNCILDPADGNDTCKFCMNAIYGHPTGIHK